MMIDEPFLICLLVFLSCLFLCFSWFLQPVYNKDDFFDSLSSNMHGNASQNGRTRYSEQIKIDTEVIPIFRRSHIWGTMFNSFADLWYRRLVIL